MPRAGIDTSSNLGVGFEPTVLSAEPRDWPLTPVSIAWAASSVSIHAAAA
jgi:hypothetical protein